MKSEHIVANTKEKQYPYIGRSIKSGMCVLFVSEGNGTVIYEVEKKYGIGFIKDGWFEPTFAPLDSREKIILQND